MPTIAEYQDRISKLKIDTEIKRRENEKAIEEARHLLESITQDEIRQLTNLIPEAAILNGLTIECLLENKNNEKKSLTIFSKKCAELLDNMLEHYEGMI